MAEHDTYDTPHGRVLFGDVRKVLSGCPDDSVHCCITSPPYYGLRDYGVDGQIGLEDTLQGYIQSMVLVMREVRRVLHPTGTLWLNIGDSYAGSRKGRKADGSHDRERSGVVHSTGQMDGTITHVARDRPAKNLLGVPWRLAFALQDDGWILRSDIVWNKTNPAPESVVDRPSKAHEYIFMLTKSRDYFYDLFSTREPAKAVSIARMRRGVSADSKYARGAPGQPVQSTSRARPNDPTREVSDTRSMRTVWDMATKPFKGGHFAPFPPELPGKAITAGCPVLVCGQCGAPHCTEILRKKLQDDRQSHVRVPGRLLPTCGCGAEPVPGVVLDPFLGSGTTAMVAEQMGRRWLGVELNTGYLPIIKKRLGPQPPLGLC